MATTYVPVRAMIPSAQPLEFVVIENAAVVARGRELFADDRCVSFRTDLPSPPERFAIAHFGSSLQYIDDWKG